MGEFGGVRHAYKVLDDDGSNSVTLSEFRKACRVYGFDQNAVPLFRALDVESSGYLSIEEVAFLDSWGFGEPADPAENDGKTGKQVKIVDAVQVSVVKRPTIPQTPMVLARSESSRKSLAQAPPIRTPSTEVEQRVRPSLVLAESVYSSAPTAEPAARLKLKSSHGQRAGTGLSGLPLVSMVLEDFNFPEARPAQTGSESAPKDDTQPHAPQAHDSDTWASLQDFGLLCARPRGGTAGARSGTAGGSARGLRGISSGTECFGGLMPTLDEILAPIQTARPRSSAKPWMRLPGIEGTVRGAPPLTAR